MEDEDDEEKDEERGIFEDTVTGITLVVVVVIPTAEEEEEVYDGFRTRLLVRSLLIPVAGIVSLKGKEELDSFLS